MDVAPRRYCRKMRKRVRLETIAVRDLNRRPGEILARVRAGERFVVCHHRRPVATLQPLDGVVVQPFAGSEYDIEGSRLGDARDEAAKLGEVERDLLARGVWRGRVLAGRIAERWSWGETMGALDELRLRGLAMKTHAGYVPTGRGWLLHEALAAVPRGERDWTRI